MLTVVTLIKISTKGRYGLRAMIELAGRVETQSCVTLKSIADSQGISENYLEQLIAILKKSGFVKSVRGAQGGYVLARPPREITVAEVLRALEGAMYPVDCLSEGGAGSCGSQGCDNCVTKPIWEKMYESMQDVLESYTVYDLASGNMGKGE